MADEKKGILGGILGGKDDKEDEKAREAEMEKTKQEAKAKLDEMAKKAARRESEEKQAMATESAEAQVEEARKRAQAQLAKMREEKAKIKFIAEHKLGYDEALSTLALKYYGHATPAYYEWIYENNKDVIGDGGPNATKPGMVIKIPELPEELKD
jgi:type I site-specific restriction-modification system R (restriction) subunit